MTQEDIERIASAVAEKLSQSVEKAYVSITDFARKNSISEKTVARLIKAKRLPVKRQGRRVLIASNQELPS